MSFGKHLTQLRLTKTNYTQAQMASLLGIDLATYKKYENNDLEPSMCRMLKLAKLFEIDIFELLSYE